jgi:hypothetical protein
MDITMPQTRYNAIRALPVFNDDTQSANIASVQQNPEVRRLVITLPAQLEYEQMRVEMHDKSRPYTSRALAKQAAELRAKFMELR